MKFGSLFAGIGGFDLGFERAKMQCAWQVEIDKHCNQMLTRHWPETERFKDVRKTDGREFPAVDLISGGFPCQDVSVAGKGAGLAGERSGLWWEFHRILEEHRPAWAVIENVPGLLSSSRGLDFATVVFGLAQLGYGVAWRVLDAQNFGVPQRRRRVFIIGHLGTYRAAEVLFEPESLSRNSAPGEAQRQEVAGTFGSNAQGGFRTTDLDQIGDYKNSDKASAMKHRDYKDATDLVAAPLRSRSSPNSNLPGRGGEDDQNIVIGFVPGNSADSRGIGIQENISPPVRGGGAGAKPTVAYRKAQKAHHSEDVERWEESNVAPILDALGHGPRTASAIAEEVGVRRLMPIECERLQGFPDGWTEGLVDTHRYRLLGNAVCVPVAEWIGRRIMEHDRI